MSKFNPASKANVSNVQFDSLDLSYLEGEILTIIDALIPAPADTFTMGTNTGIGGFAQTRSQNNAAKSLIKSAFGRSLSKFGIARG